MFFRQRVARFFCLFLLYVKRYWVTPKAQMSQFSPSIQISFEAVTYFGYLHECRGCSIMHLHMY